MDLERTLAIWLLENDPGASVRALAGMDAPAMADILRQVSVPGASRVILALGPTLAAGVLSRGELGWSANVLEQLSTAAAAALLTQVGTARRDELLDALPTQVAAALRQRSRFEKNTAGALMDEIGVALPETLSVRDALKKLREDATQVAAVFVVDDEQRFVGVIETGRLLVAKPQRTLVELMIADAVPISSSTALSRLAGHPAWKDSATAAVVDGERQYVGALSLNAVVRATADTGRAGGNNEDATATALGDLFWLGIAGVLGAAAGGEPRTERR